MKFILPVLVVVGVVVLISVVARALWKAV